MPPDVQKDNALDSRVYPRYGGESLLNIPSTILKLFEVPPLKPTLPAASYAAAVGAEKVVLFLIDGLGLNLWEASSSPADDPRFSLFSRIRRQGLQQTITSVFPSSTAPAISTVNSGLSPLEHGLPEWYVYFPEFDAVVQSLPLLPVLEKERTRLRHPPPDILFDRTTIYQRLAAAGVRSFSLTPREYADSLYNRAASAGSEVLGYGSTADCLVTLRRRLEETIGPAFFYVYYPAVDAAEHRFGPNSPQVRVEVATISFLLQRELMDRLEPRTARETALFLTADHGVLDVPPQDIFYIDAIKGLREAFVVSPAGRPILPSGGPRDIYLHVQPERLAWAQQTLQERLDSRAEVLTVEEGLGRGLFGDGETHHRLRARIGNLMILPHASQAVWYRYDPNKGITMLGQHGGLSPLEMLVPFTVARLADLRD